MSNLNLTKPQRVSARRKEILANQASHHPAVVEMAMRHANSLQLKVADAITAFAGSMKFVYIHAILFGIWCGTGLFGLDKYPYNFLTMTVSLEAIFLATFVMIGQNRQAAFQQNKADHDFATEHTELAENTTLTREINALTRQVLALQQQVAKQLGAETSGDATPEA